MKRSLLAALAALALLVPAAAGDIATFVDLGFSNDSAYFMFGQYGVDPASGKAYAETYLVDTVRNDFVRNGVARKTYDVRLEPGQDASGALFSLYGEALPLVKSCRINPLAPGRLLYVLLDGEEPPASLAFRDFKTDAAWEIALQKKATETKDGVTSSFGLSVSVTLKDGTVKRVSAGNPGIKRQGVRDYIIRRIIVAPDEKTLVLIIEKVVTQKGDQSVRYMVETLRLP
jgi:predicted secreted protein